MQQYLADIFGFLYSWLFHRVQNYTILLLIFINSAFISRKKRIFAQKLYFTA